MPKKEPQANVHPPSADPGKTFDGLTFLSCDSLGELDNGFARAIIDEAIQRAANDTEQRGLQDEKPRKVIITLEFRKINDHSCVINVNADAKIPPLKLSTTFAETRPIGKGKSNIAFREDNPDRPDQPTIPYPQHPEVGDEAEESEHE